MESKPICIALGGNALKSEHNMQSFPQLAKTCEVLAAHCQPPVLVTHGNGPQIGNLVDPGQTDSSESERTLDVLGAETEGLLGYQIEQKLANSYNLHDRVVTVLTRVEVDPEDPAFDNPSKPIGSWMDSQRAQELRDSLGWHFTSGNEGSRRVVPSPLPRCILNLHCINLLLDTNYCVVAAGGGGIPVVRESDGSMKGVEAVVDKDHTSSLMARELGAQRIYFLTDVSGVYSSWGSDDKELIEEISEPELRKMDLPEGSMGPKALAACNFVAATGGEACIGALSDLEALLQRRGGTRVVQG